MTPLAEKRVVVTGKPSGQPRRCLDTTRAQEAFGFTSKIGIREGLRRTIDWYVDRSGQIK